MSRVFQVVLSAVCGLLLTASLPAQESDDPKPADAVSPAPTPATTVPEEATTEDPLLAWKTALDRRVAIFEQLQELKKAFADTKKREEQQKVRDQYTDLIREFEVSVYPKMLDLAEDVYAQQPDDLDAGEIVMQKAFNQNLYETSAAIAAKLVAADRRTKNALSMGAVSQFALHNFEEALTLMNEAKAENRLDPRYQGYVDATSEYIEFWKTEKAIREREAALEGDQALPRVEFDTSRGKILIELFEDQAPNSVANFVSLVEGGKYDGVKFHRVIPGFMAQGGDPNSLDEDPGNDGLGGPGYSIKCECYREDARMHFRGSLSMAHSGLDSGGSQFFLTHLPTEWLNPRMVPEKGGHTVFGRVIDGMDIVAIVQAGDEIKKATVVRKRPHEYKPELTLDVIAPGTDADPAS
jgi:cyclophilin family peptidyl-prolyl cis-trans isomerase